MLVWLPTFLDGLFNMLSDVNRLIRNTADSALSDFLKELKLTTSVEFGPCTKSEVGKYNNTKKAKNEEHNRVVWKKALVVKDFYSFFLLQTCTIAPPRIFSI